MLGVLCSDDSLAAGLVCADARAIHRVIQEFIESSKNSVSLD